MSLNRFGHLLTFTTWGESHGPAIGCVIDGCPPRIALGEGDIQPFLDRRRPGQSAHTTQRREPDRAKILSGVFEGRTTGTPIAVTIDNEDARSGDYAAIAERYRPGHADFSYDAKYGIRDPRGGGRASARETANRVVAGAVARRILEDATGGSFAVRGALVEMGGDPIDRGRWDDAEIDRNPFGCPDAAAASRWDERLATVRREGSSLGAVIEVAATGVPAGLGAPVYGKLDAELAAALMGINAVKGVEIGDGFAAARLRGEENADEIRMGSDGAPAFLANHAGGILGGISTGQPIVARFAVKPTSSLLVPVRSVTRSGEEVETRTTGRHDPCVGIRAVPVGEAMVAFVLADQLLRHRGQTGAAPARTNAGSAPGAR